VCLYVYICVYVIYKCIYVYTCIFVFMYSPTLTQRCIVGTYCMCVYMNTYVYVCAYMYVCFYVYNSLQVRLYTLCMYILFLYMYAHYSISYTCASDPCNLSNLCLKTPSSYTNTSIKPTLRMAHLPI
jgi:hypothetical protein